MRSYKTRSESRRHILLPKVIIFSLILSGPFFTEATSISMAKSCSKSDLAKYKKARQQFINDNTIIQISNDIKAIIEDARRQKSELYGRFVDYTARDLYDLERQDNSIAKAEAHRDEWESELRRLAKKCGKKMTSKSELRKDYYND